MGPGRKYVHSQGHTVGYGSARWLLLSSGSQTQSEEEAGVAGAGETHWGQGGDRAWLVMGVGELASHCPGSPQALPGGARGSWAGMKRPALAVAWREKGREKAPIAHPQSLAPALPPHPSAEDDVIPWGGGLQPAESPPPPPLGPHVGEAQMPSSWVSPYRVLGDPAPPAYSRPGTFGSGGAAPTWRCLWPPP